MSPPLGWAMDQGAVFERRTAARTLIGHRLAAVRYINIDYVGIARPELEGRGPRMIENREEWNDPTWDFDSIHSIDYGIELETTDRRIYAMTWDPPGNTESLSFSEGPLLGRRLVQDAGAAIWDVTDRSPWRECIGQPVTDVMLDYQPWAPNEPGFWCTRLVLAVGDRHVEVILGEARSNDVLTPSADNLAVLVQPETAAPDQEPLAT